MITVVTLFTVLCEKFTLIQPLYLQTTAETGWWENHLYMETEQPTKRHAECIGQNLAVDCG